MIMSIIQTYPILLSGTANRHPSYHRSREDPGRSRELETVKVLPTGIN